MKDAVRPAPTAFKLKSVELPWLDADGDAESSAVFVWLCPYLPGQDRTFL